MDSHASRNGRDKKDMELRQRKRKGKKRELHGIRTLKNMRAEIPTTILHK